MIKANSEAISATCLMEAVAYLRGITGIDLPEHRQGVLAQVLAPLARDGDILERLASDKRAMSRVIHAVTIPETYLFRHPGHFRALAELARERHAAGRECRVLCAGCATGEEVWSVAAVLAEVYWPSRRYAVEGWDLDGERIRKAAWGEVRDWGARAGLAGYDRFFQRVPGGFTVIPELRPGVSFREVNLAAPLLPASCTYDVIFFRNVAIYWELACTRRVVERLVGLLADDGLFLAGPGDPVVLDRENFQGSIRDQVLIHRRKTARAATTVVPAPLAKKAFAARRPAIPLPKVAGPAAANTSPDPLRQAERLADAGFLTEALTLLDGRQPPAGRVLAGVVLLQLDRVGEAEQKFRQAVFLEPQVASHRRWLALGLDSLGRAEEAARERRIAAELES